jgi:hypothetical protein
VNATSPLRVLIVDNISLGLLMDLRLPKKSGVDATAEIARGVLAELRSELGRLLVDPPAGQRDDEAHIVGEGVPLRGKTQ